MKYGFEISDFSATIYNIISANFTINLGVNVRGWGQNEQIVTKYPSWCRGSNNGVDGLQSAAPPTGHRGWKTGGKMWCSGRAFRLQIWDELSPCIRVIRLGPVTSTAASLVPALLPARGTSSYCSGAIQEWDIFMIFGWQYKSIKFIKWMHWIIDEV